MITFIIGALEEEIEGIRAETENVTEEKAGAFTVYRGKLCGGEIILCRCGVGKTNAAAAASAVLAAFPDIGRVMNVGVAGGIGGGIKRGEIALGERTVHHDYDQTADGLRKGQVEGFDSEYFCGDPDMLAAMERALAKEKIGYRKGVIASGDRFVASHSEAKRINEEFDAIACDFESAPIAQVCALYKVPFLSVRAASDDGGDGAVESFYEFLSKVTVNIVRGVKEFMRLS